MKHINRLYTCFTLPDMLEIHSTCRGIQFTQGVNYVFTGNQNDSCLTSMLFFLPP